MNIHFTWAFQQTRLLSLQWEFVGPEHEPHCSNIILGLCITQRQLTWTLHPVAGRLCHMQGGWTAVRRDSMPRLQSSKSPSPSYPSSVVASFFSLASNSLTSSATKPQTRPCGRNKATWLTLLLLNKWRGDHVRSLDFLGSHLIVMWCNEYYFSVHYMHFLRFRYVRRFCTSEDRATSFLA